jgi:hypothetical protein
MDALGVDHDEIGLPAYLECADYLSEPQGVRAAARGVLERVLGLGQ